jgi:hypothetical protein
VDVNNDGRVSIREFLTHFERQIKLPQMQLLDKMDDDQAVDALRERCMVQFSGLYGSDLLRKAFGLLSAPARGG